VLVDDFLMVGWERISFNGKKQICFWEREIRQRNVGLTHRNIGRMWHCGIDVAYMWLSD